MLILLTPSKTMNFSPDLPFSIPVNQPLFLEKAHQIATAIQKLSEKELQALMKVSPAIATNVKKMYENWSSEGQKPALWVYAGDVYKGMYANQLTKKQAEWAQKHVLIMSGLYGILRPYDVISPYRLEMKARIKIDRAKDLYDFWGNDLTDYVEKHADGLLFNLASDEYGSAVTKNLSPNIRIITPVFYDERPSGVGRAPIYNKMMRGVMARWMIDHGAEHPDDLKQFTGHGYLYDASRSTLDSPAFYRGVMKPLVF